MSRVSTSKEALWAIVLAGGEGKRMCPLIERWLGQEQPKQYCCFFGSKSLLEYSVDRILRLVGEERLVTIIGRGHRSYIRQSATTLGRILEQPAARGTGPGVLLPLSYVCAKDPEAKVVILPSDHFISPEGPFLRILKEAARLLDYAPQQMVLIGVHPDRPESEYGWIEPGSKPSYCGPLEARAVNTFIEKPGSAEARNCFNCGYFWNTMIVVTRAQTLWSLVGPLYPSVVKRFQKLQQGFSAILNGWVSKEAEDLILAETYSNMPEFDFSRDFLAHSAQNCLTIPLKDVRWNDLGRPRRLLEVFDHAECTPNIPLHLLEY